MFTKSKRPHMTRKDIREVALSSMHGLQTSAMIDRRKCTAGEIERKGPPDASYVGPSLSGAAGRSGSEPALQPLSPDSYFLGSPSRDLGERG